MSILNLDRPKVFRDVKEAPIRLLLFILLFDVVFNWLYVHLLRQAFAIPGLYTAGLISPLHILCFLKFVFVVYGIIFWIGRFKPMHLGLTAKKMKYGILTTFLFWALIQVAQVVNSYMSLGRIDFLSGWNQRQLFLVAGSFFLYAFTKALFDEITYRGLMLPQLHLKIRRYVNLSDHITLALALIVSQALYIVIQLPILNLVDTTEISSTLTFASVFFLSILNALIYLRTKNLYIAIGLHALWYNPAFVVTPSLPHTFILVILAIIFILIWPLLPNTPSLMATWPLQHRRPA